MKDDQKEVLIQSTSTGFALLQSIQSQDPIQPLLWLYVGVLISP